jgi:hypothetical protein
MQKLDADIQDINKKIQKRLEKTFTTKYPAQNNKKDALHISSSFVKN